MYSQKKVKNAEINIRIRMQQLKILLGEINTNLEKSQNSLADFFVVLRKNYRQMENGLNDLEREIGDLVNLRQEEIIRSQESERRKIARELHDGPAQTLAAAIIKLELAESLYPEDQQQGHKDLEQIKNICRKTLGDIRHIMFDLRPLVLDQGLAHTLAAFFRDYNAKYNLDVDFRVSGGEKKYNTSLEFAILRLVQEAVTNVRKHAGVNRALVSIDDNAGVLTLVIKDKGAGFDINEISGMSKESYGILGMKERAQLLGGTIKFKSTPGMGTEVIIKVPVEGEKFCG